jgi:hypothetical protein
MPTILWDLSSLGIQSGRPEASGLNRAFISVLAALACKFTSELPPKYEANDVGQ